MYRLTLVVCGVLALGAMCLADEYSGEYRICANTKHQGCKCMEAYPNDDVIRMNDPRLDQDQKWKIERTGQGASYRVSALTRHQGRQFIEAYPGLWVIRPEPEKDSQDQLVYIEVFSGGPANSVRLTINTAASGWKALEAYPNDDVVRTKDSSTTEQDQQWFITPWSQTTENRCT